MLKSQLIASVNSLRKDAGLPPYTPEKAADLTRADLERIEYELCVPAFDPRVAKKEPTVAQLLARLNIYRRKLGQTPLKAWKQSRSLLLIAIGKANVEQMAKAPKTVCPPAIADGADTKRNHTSLYKNGLVKKVRAQRIREERIIKSATPEQHRIAERINKQTGYTVSDLVRFLIAHPEIKFPNALDNAEKNMIARWLRSDAGQEPTHHAAAQTKAKGERLPNAPRDADYLTPSHLAALVGRDPRAVRMFLRKREKDITAAWRVSGVRWGFHKQHQAAIVKFIKGGSK